jgi:hypothetical protein
MQATLGRLGIPLDFSQSDQQAAFAGGLAKAGIFRGYKSLETGDLDSAIQSFTIVIESSLGKGRPGMEHTLAVAHFLRGSAYERKGVVPAALSDYTSALRLWPAHADARQAYERLVGRS